MTALRRMGVDWKERRLIGNLYMGQRVKIRIDGEYSEPGRIGRGVRQGCPLSPILFNIYIELIVREALEEMNEGVKVGGRLIKALRFADDQAMMAHSQEGLQRMMDRLNTISTEYEMKINTKKTKVMKISRMEESTVKITINGEDIEQVNKFCYLGSVVTQDAKCHTEIKRRINMGKDAFCKRKELLRGKLNRTLKKRMVKTLVWSVVLYGSETWTMRKEDIKRLEAFEMWIWRRMERSKLEGAQDKRGNIKNGRRRKISDKDNQRTSKEMDGTRHEGRLSTERHHRGENGREKDKRKTKNDAAGLGDGEKRLQQNEERGSKSRKMASLDI